MMIRLPERRATARRDLPVTGIARSSASGEHNRGCSAAGPSGGGFRAMIELGPERP